MITYNETECGGVSIGNVYAPIGTSFARRAMREVERGEAEIIPFDHDKAEEEKAREAIFNKIIELEATITPRNWRGAYLGDDYAIDKIKEVEDQIAALRE